MRNIILLCLVSFAFVAKSQNMNEQVTGIHKYLDFKSKHVSARTIEVLLPPNYDENKKYPVLYMHDGQMLFDASITWNQQEWGVDEVVYGLIDANIIRPVIVVGVWFGDRYAEYMPNKPKNEIQKVKRTDKFKGEIVSDQYLKFLVEELKPFIDEKYNTLKGVEDTFILGSSMGGLISCYAISEYPDVFGGAACMSTHWPALDGVFLGYVEKNLPDPKSHKIYFDYGTETLDSLYQPYQQKVDLMMKKKGFRKNQNWMTRKFEGAKHDENAWRDRLHIPLEFMLGKKE
ncbi:alpha/beta hydrolase [Marinifilum sp. D737]|uniref:alpha/beta hydrolase n=1 Tax=Marinifilum sp. D737 TaxID=2969628 RepID=UPI002276A6C8|nr:alpha/beta hydrolase-fold protein [Marinifilum sp. D737]MCY1633789.1 esterase family protein [Marinifilum sp. D737]